MLRNIKIAAALLLTLALPAAAGGLKYKITIQNLIPGGADTGQPFSPPVVAVHNAGYSMFEPGGWASPGLEQVSREGNPTVLQMEAQSSPDVYSVVVGTGPYFDSQVVNIDGTPGELISMAWMIGRTNDLFSGLHDIVLPASGTVHFDLQAWDSGTEVNTGLIQDIPFYGNHNVGPDEHVPIAMINSYTVYNDPTYGQLIWNFPPTGSVTIEVDGAVPAASTTWGAVKSLYR